MSIARSSVPIGERRATELVTRLRSWSPLGIVNRQHEQLRASTKGSTRASLWKGHDVTTRYSIPFASCSPAIAAVFDFATLPKSQSDNDGAIRETANFLARVSA